MGADAYHEREMPIEEFLGRECDENQRWELVDGRPVVMKPPTQAHGTLVANLASWIGPALRKMEPCRLITEAGIVPVERPNTYFLADLVVSCQPHFAGAQAVEDPIIVVEVLPPFTEGQDRWNKLANYRRIPSVCEILLVDQTRRYCELLRRFDETRWLSELYIGAEATFRLDSIELELSLEDVYAKVDVAPDSLCED